MKKMIDTDAYDRLRTEILHGDLAPGERLRVADLNSRFNLGLTPIREALMRLSSEGLVEALANRGARVRETTLGELQDLMETRRTIEALCVRRSMEKGDSSWEADILHSLHMLVRAPLPISNKDRDAAAEWERRHRTFHYCLVSACGSAWHLRFWNTLVDHSERYRKLRLLNHKTLAADVRNVNAEHEDIANAIIARKADKAVSLMNEHLCRTESAVARLLSEKPIG